MNLTNSQSAGRVLRSALVGRCGYLGPLLCNFFFRKNNFEGTFLTDELAQWKFLMYEIPVYEKSTDCIFGWLPSFAIVISYCVAFCDYFKLRTLIRTSPAVN